MTNTILNFIRLFFEGTVYYQVADIHIMFEMSKGRIKREIESQGIETRVIKGFGRKKWISERELNRLVIDGVTLDVGTTVKCKEIEMKSAIKAANIASSLCAISLPEHMREKYVLNSIYAQIENVNKRFNYEIKSVENESGLCENMVNANKELRDKNLAFRYVQIDFKNAGFLKDSFEGFSLFALINSNMDVLHISTYDVFIFEEYKDKFLFDCSENWNLEDILDVYGKNVSVEYGNVAVDYNKIIKNLFNKLDINVAQCYDGGMGEVLKMNDVEISLVDFATLLRNDTLITLISDGLNNEVININPEDIIIENNTEIIKKFEDMTEIEKMKDESENGVIYAAKKIEEFHVMEQTLKSINSHMINNPIERAKRWIEEQEQVITPDEILESMPIKKEIKSMEEPLKKCETMPLSNDKHLQAENEFRKEAAFGVMIDATAVKKVTRKAVVKEEEKEIVVKRKIIEFEGLF